MLTGWEMVHFLSKAPGKVKYPIQWASAKQKRWYFWFRRQIELGRVKTHNIILAGMGKKWGSGGGWARTRKLKSFIKYQRQTDSMSSDITGSWRVDRKGSRDAVVGTPVSYAPYVQGSRTAGYKQQRFHANTGWRTDQDAVNKILRGRTIEKIFVQQLKKQLGSLLK